jgi:chemotaxis protein methyltransferase CheR
MSDPSTGSTGSTSSPQASSGQGLLPPELLARLSSSVAEHLGLHFPPTRWADLERGARSAAREFGFSEVGACAQWLTSAPLSRRQVETLASHLTIGETYFYRERAAFAALEQHVMPQLAASRQSGQRRLRIWSAACCTGEEAYSLAIAATRGLPEPGRWDISVLATDINPHFLEKAAAGIYGEWSFRDTPPFVRQQYCRPMADGRFQVVPEIRKLVTFDHLNLADDSYPSLLNQTNGLDLIFCRNLLIYFEPVLGARVGRKLGHCLSDGGWLFVGAAETSSLLFGELEAVNYSGAIVYRKSSTPAPRPRPAFVPPAGASPVAPIGLAEIRSGPRPRPAPAPPTPLVDATALFDQGRYAEVVQTLAGPVAQGQAEAALLARAHANLGQLSEALACCERAIGANKLSPGLHYLRGTILAEKGEPEEAAREFRRATYLAPDFVMAHFGLGHLARGGGNAAGAARHFARAVRLLRDRPPDEPLPESEGITAARLADVIAMLETQ